MNKKCITLGLILLLLFSVTVNAQKKRDLIKEINAFKRDVVSNASFDKDFEEVWDAIYVIATEEYNTIKRESESRGYIDAAQESDTYHEYMTIEVRGKEAPYKVSFQVKQERRTKNQDGSFSNWQVFTSSTIRAYYLRLRTRLYEILNGPLQFSDELASKLESYNSKQTKERKKILKGKDY